MSVDYLKGLNAAQLEAVQHAPHVPLQILAGPGSGKTKVLTSRIAHLITVHGVPPGSICAVTFTNKASSEMRERLCKLVGRDITGQIKLGTFHALCAMFLRKYATLVGVGANFTVCDADESKKVVTRLLKSFTNHLHECDIVLKEATVLSRISKAKAKGLTVKDLLELSTSPPSSSSNKAPTQIIEQVVAKVFEQYQLQLKQSNSLDFDDLLVYGVKLFRDHPEAGKWCQHVLVDEFQDTNTLQYELMTYIARAKRCISIVGDPDQSIYGWRSAEVENLARMQRDFPTTRQIFLEQNYRSTGAILAASVAIISQDKGRIAKTLHTSHANGILPVLHPFPNEQAEGESIAAEIQRMIAHSGGMLSYSDFAILLRMNSLSRVIESALQKEGIPQIILGGHRFFDRMEVKDLIAYLQVVDNPHFVPAFVRVINIPSRTIGEKTISGLLAKAEKLRQSPLEVVERIYDGKIPDIKPPIKRKIASFVDTIRNLRKLALKGENPGNLIRQLLELINYQDHLRKHHDDSEARWDNVEELVNFASEFEYNPAPSLAGSPAVVSRKEKENPDLEEEDWMDDEDDEDVDFDEGSMKYAKQNSDTPLRAFLQASMLATDTEAEKDDPSQKDKVTIATCHAAKGLEWPVVFIPAVESGVFPLGRAEDIEEERRLLYVACTRAQGLLYLSHCTSRMTAGSLKQRYLSEFLTILPKEQQGLFSPQLTGLTAGDRKVIATVLGRPIPTDEDIRSHLEEHRVKTQFKPSICPFSRAGVDPESPLPPQGFSYVRGLSVNGVQPSAPSQAYASFTSAKLSVPAAYLKSPPVPFTAPMRVPGPGIKAHPPPANAKASESMKSGQTSILSYTKGQPRSIAALPARSLNQARTSKVPPRHSHGDDEAAAMPEVSVDTTGAYRPSVGAKTHGAQMTGIPSGTATVSRAPRVTSLSNRSKAIASTDALSKPKLVSVAETNPNVRILGSTQNAPPPAPIKPAGGKRRLGMGGAFVGYSNKKFKSPIA